MQWKKQFKKVFYYPFLKQQKSSSDQAVKVTGPEFGKLSKKGQYQLSKLEKEVLLREVQSQNFLLWAVPGEIRLLVRNNSDDDFVYYRCPANPTKMRNIATKFLIAASEAENEFWNDL
jgi:hypothetical protein